MQALTILVVDDDKNIVFTLGEILKLHNWTVDIAEDGFKAIALSKEKKYDVILLDIKMPGIDGIQTFEEVKKLQPGAIIFLMTADSAEQFQNMQDKGVSTIIQKPIDITRIIKLIGDLEKKGTVFIVDDSENDRSLLADILSEKGFKVMTAKTGSEAVELARNNEFDVMILDLRLPDMDGISVLETVKKFKPASSIVTVTGYCLDGLINDIIDKGAYTCLLKPFDMEILLREINNLINKKDSGNRSLRDSKKVDVNILVVEDDSGTRETVKEVLAEEGYGVKAVETVQKALELISAENFDIVISDLYVGKDSGLSLVDPVRAKDKLSVFLLVTGDGTMETAVEAVKKNVDEYMIKPIKPAELLQKVKTYLAKQKLEKEKEYLLKQLQESNIRLLELSKTDELTGLFNRRSLFEQIHAEMQRAKRQTTPLCLMMCGVDGFKKFNDANGHNE
jgi:DNA-binding NtrC family response regulator